MRGIEEKQGQERQEEARRGDNNRTLCRGVGRWPASRNEKKGNQS